MKQRQYFSVTFSSLVSTLVISLAVGSFFAYVLGFILAALMRGVLNPHSILYLYGVSWIVVFVLMWTRKEAQNRRRTLRALMLESKRVIPVEIISNVKETNEDDMLEA